MERAPERKQTIRLYVVLQINATEPEGGGHTFQDVATVATLKAARKWVKDNGKAGERYQPACLIGLPCEVLVVATEKRTLATA